MAIGVVARRIAFVLCAVLTAGLFATSAAAESRSYAIEWFSLASYSQDGDCPGGVNPPTREQYFKTLELLGYSPDQAKALMVEFAKGGIAKAKVDEILRMRGRIDAKPVNGFVFPWAVADPEYHSVAGKYAFGFNLNNTVDAISFEDPVTHERGIKNQLFRALGCVIQFRGSYTYRPTFWEFIWGSMKVTTSAWLFTVTGADLSKDGPVTITFDRAIEHLVFGASGEATADATYRIDPDQRSHHSFKGEIRNGELTITEHSNLSLQLDTLSFIDLQLHNFHMRLSPNKRGNLEGFMGGYQPWADIYFSFAQGGLAYEDMIINDTPGDYYLLKKAADAEPDPKTGQNMAISAAYHIEAVPVFAVPATDEARRVSQ